MAGFRDLWALLLGWKSSRPLRSAYYLAFGQVHVTGVGHGPDRPAAAIHSSGPKAGQIHG